MMSRAEAYCTSQTVHDWANGLSARSPASRNLQSFDFVRSSGFSQGLKVLLLGVLKLGLPALNEFILAEARRVDSLLHKTRAYLCDLAGQRSPSRVSRSRVRKADPVDSHKIGSD
jgi:hypothetical protein